jgi:hypothetical protein
MESPIRPEDRTNGPSGEEVARAKQNVVGRLLQRGIVAFEQAPADQLVALLEAVELFEVTAAARSCDSFTNALDSSQPDDPSCQLPEPAADETLEAYTKRVRAKTEALRAED